MSKFSKLFLVLSLPTLLCSCDLNSIIDWFFPSSTDTTQSSSSSSSSSSTTSSSSSTSTSSSSTSSSKTSSTSSSSSSSSSSGSQTTSTSSSSGSSSSSSEAISTFTSIKAVKDSNKNGELVRFDATYLRQITLVNIDLMYFADAEDTIWLRVPYASFTGHMANLYHMKEYTITGRLNITSDYTELTFDETIGKYDSVVTKGDTYPLSYNKETSPISVDGIAKIKEMSGQIKLDNKYYGAGDLVKFTSQIVQTEYTDANKKAMVLDPSGDTITVIGDDKKMVNEDDIGKYYEWVGIISVKSSIPAILGIECTYVPHSASEESVVDVSNATEVSPSYFAKWNLTSSKYNPASNDDYFKLYKSTGYVKDNIDITTSYNLGMVDKYSDTLSDAGSTSTVKGFYLTNCKGLDEKGLSYCPFAGYMNQEFTVEIYYAIRQYDTSNHLWEMFVIESLIPELE